MSSPSFRKLSVAFETEEELRRVFDSGLAVGALFVPTYRDLPPGSAVKVTLGLPFAKGKLLVAGEVVAVLSGAMSKAGATPGLSILLAERGDALRKRLEQERHPGRDDAAGGS